MYEINNFEIKKTAKEMTKKNMIPDYLENYVIEEVTKENEY